jgi:uncharacterized SAM-binding protein YcdF (DUF218 family)
VGQGELKDMTFILTKFGGDLLRPSVLLLLLCWAGFWFGRYRDSAWGRRLLAAGLIGYLLILLLPVDSWVSLPLEDRFPRPAEPSNIDGIIVLGGAIATEITRDRGIPSLNADAERMTEAVALALRHPEARLVFTGASGSVIPGGAIETDGARQLFAALGLDPARIVFEDRSRNTRENASDSWRLVHPARESCWLLITSASHVPRAIGVFRHIGWNVTAWPVAYKSGRTLRAWVEPSFSSRLGNLDAATHEWLGLFGYRLIGWTDTLFPAPQDAAKCSLSR